MLTLKNLAHPGVKGKFILWFLLAALIPLVIATSLSYSTSKKVLESEVTKSLFAIADNKANRINSYLEDQKKNAATLSYTPELINITEQFKKALEIHGKNSPEYDRIDQKFRPFLTYYKKLFAYDDLSLVAPNGDILFSATSDNKSAPLFKVALYEKSGFTKNLKQVEITLKTENSDFFFLHGVERPASFIVAPVINGATLVGFVVPMLTNKNLSEITSDRTGLGKTGEIILFTETDKNKIPITPMRFAPKNSRSVPSSELEDQKPMEELLKNKNDSDVTTDYRHKEVLSVWKYLPGFKLGMIVKMDMYEVMRSARILRNKLLLLSLLLLVGVVLAALAIAQSFSAPIKELTRTSTVIANGDLTARANVATDDEIGELARSFNEMTDKLLQAKDNVEAKKTELEEQQLLLEKANKELDTFVYTASHDLRAPLRGIKAFADFLSQEYTYKLDDKGKHYIEKIKTGITRMSSFINDLLTLSKISRIKNPFEKIDSEEIAKSIIEVVKFDHKNSNIEISIDTTLPHIVCDRIKFEMILSNLINNAVKFSEKKDASTPRINVGYKNTPKDHIFFVKDNGIGIDKKFHEEIFGLFKRLHSQGEYDGTGAGLNIVKKLVEDQCGKIWVQSEVGLGSTFFFSIPENLTN